jgi:alkylated DNA repair dioxygenase AlkB
LNAALYKNLTPMAEALQVLTRLDQAPPGATIIDLRRGAAQGLWREQKSLARSEALRDDRAGPVTIYPGKQPIEALDALRAWWYTQLFAEHSVGAQRPLPTLDHARWLIAGVQSGDPLELGSGEAPLCHIWRDHRVNSAAAYLLAYVPLYVEGLIRSPTSRAALLALRRKLTLMKGGHASSELSPVYIRDGTGMQTLEEAIRSPRNPSPAPVLRALLQDTLCAELLAAATVADVELTPRDLPPDLRPLLEEEKLPGLVGGAEVFYRAQFLNCMADRYFELLRPGGAAQIPWERRHLKMFGKTVKEGHDTAFFGDPGTRYRYTGVDHETLPWERDPSGALAELRDLARYVTGHPYDLGLMNFYRPPDSIGAHADDERDLVPGSPILSISLGRARLFGLQTKAQGSRGRVTTKRLAHGSLLVMAGQTQQVYKHYVNAEPMPAGAAGPEDRVNITFRCVVKR